MTGIVSWGSYIPRLRIKVQEIAKANGLDSFSSEAEKSLPGIDEDTATMAVEAARNALKGYETKEIEAIYIGSESHPYAVKPTSTIVGEALDIGNDYTAADFQFACKAGTAAIQAGFAMVKAKQAKYAICGGSDTAQSSIGDNLEYTAGAGAAMFLIGENPCATINHTLSYSSDTPDFWRKKNEKYPQHAGTFTGEPSYFRHISNAVTNLMKKANSKPGDYDHVIFHQPNDKFPKKIAKKLGFTDEQIKFGMLVNEIGNTYSACSILGLCAVLDTAKPNQRILLASYGSGAGSDCFDITTNERIIGIQKKIKGTREFIHDKIFVSYIDYLKNTGKLK